MPTIADYLRLAPFTLDELVAATNGVLRGHPRLEVTRRTLRYYLAQGVLPPPLGPPKFARYEAEHLLRAVALRVVTARGRTIAEASTEADRLLLSPVDEAANALQALVADLPESAKRSTVVEEMSQPELQAEADYETLNDDSFGGFDESAGSSASLDVPKYLRRSAAPTPSPLDEAASPRTVAPIPAKKQVRPAPAQSVLRIEVEPGITIEVPGPEMDRGVLERAAASLRKLLDSL